MLLLGARSPEDAEPYLGRAAELAPSDPRPWELLGNIAVGRRDFATALVVLTKALAAGSTSYLVYHNLAISRLPELTQPWIPNASLDPHTLDAAAEDFRKAIQLSPRTWRRTAGSPESCEAWPRFCQMISIR